MAIVNQEIDQRGLGPQALNVQQRFVGYPKVSGTANALSITMAAVTSQSSTLNSTTTTGAGSTVTTFQTSVSFVSTSTSLAGTAAAGVTQPDYARNLAYSMSASANSAQISGGGVTVSGIDMLGNSRSESRALTGLISSGTFFSGTGNFRYITGATVNIFFQTGITYTSGQTSNSTGGTTTASAGTSVAPAFTLRVGAGEKIALPVNIYRTNFPSVQVKLSSVDQTTTATGTSTSNNATSTVTITSISPLFTVSTGGPFENGVIVSALASGSLLEVDYKLNGFL